MPTREQILAEQTHKEDGLSVEERIFYTIVVENSSPRAAEIRAHRLAKFTGKLAALMVERGVITEEHLDELLLHIVMS